MGCGIVTLDGVFLNVNDNLLRMLALPAEKVIGKTGVELGLWKSQSDRDEFYRRLRAEGSVQNLEIRFKDATGVEHIGLYFATLVRIGDKECIFGMQLDQTEERELEAKFLQAQKMEALGRLAGGVAHDFNNLLGVIGGYAELLESKLENNESLRRYCGKIIDTTQRASGLTRQLLTFSRKEIVRPMPLQTGEALQELTAILPRLIGEDIEFVGESARHWNRGDRQDAFRADHLQHRYQFTRCHARRRPDFYRNRRRAAPGTHFFRQRRHWPVRGHTHSRYRHRHG